MSNLNTLSIATICQDEEEPIRWYLECCKHAFSVLQTRLHEIVIVDGGSKDNTIDVIKEYQKEIPITLLERPFDIPRNQMNFALEHCTAEFVFTPDADMTWTTNFPEKFATNFYNTGNYWDFLILFTARDAYHYFFKWPVGPNIRMHRRGPKWTRNYHVRLERQPTGPALCREVTIFENSCRIKSEAALINRGERRQSHITGMEEEGGHPGPVNRFLDASKLDDHHVRHVSSYRKGLESLILPSTNS